MVTVKPVGDGSAVLRFVPFKRACTGAFKGTVPDRVEAPSNTIGLAAASAATGVKACSTLPDCSDCKYTQ
jgi:hypothetical protein